MPSGPHFRTSLLGARERLAKGREKIRAQHERGSPGVQISTRLAELLDGITMMLWEAALADLDLEPLRQEVALVPHSGYGRRDVAPYSDLDLMILHSGSAAAAVRRLATRLTQDLYDVGLDPGHSVRTSREAIALAGGDVQIATSLMESRFLAGNQDLHRRFADRYQTVTRRRYRGLHEQILVARRDERAQYGETVYLLQPNVKRSRGTLREIQLLRWIGYARFGTADIDALQRLGALSREDRRRLHAAREFLLRLRNELHFHAGKSQDALERSEQVRIAEKFGFRGTGALLPVEQFMREYFRHTSQVRNLVARFVKGVAPRAAVGALLAPIVSRQVEGDYVIGPQHIRATRQGLEKLERDMAEVLRLAVLASAHDKRIDPRTWDAVGRAAPGYPDEVSSLVAERFLALLDQPARLGQVLRRLHGLRVLEKIIPEFAHARGLLQFNEYHKYTVDEHSFRAVRNATELTSDEKLLGEVYRGIKQKRVLHLALLLHDLGKGHEEDHSEVGRRIAAATGPRLGLSDRETEMVEFLVEKHLVMSHLAFRRDTSDESLVLDFAVQVGSPEMLQMLLVLTCADLEAVGPGVLNNWKIDVLGQLYHRAMRHLAGDVAGDAGRWAEKLRDEVRCALGDEAEEAWYARQVAALSGSYLRTTPPAAIVEMLCKLRLLEPREAAAWGEFQPETETVAYTVIVNQGRGRGAFARLTGGLASQGLVILSAEIDSLADEAILDRFIVEDPDHDGPPPAERIDQVCQALVACLADDSERPQPPRFRRVWGDDRRAGAERLVPRASEVRVDNNTSDRFTILDIFTYDRTGLLFTIARTLHEQRLSIARAKIGTYLDQVLDVFYVTDQEGGKIVDESRLEEIRGALLGAVEGGDGGVMSDE